MTAFGLDRFGDVFGTRAGGSAPVADPRVRTALDAGNLRAAARAFGAGRDTASAKALADALAAEALERRFGGRVRKLLDLCGTLPEQALTLVTDSTDPDHLIHVWPQGAGDTTLYGRGREKHQTACGLSFSDRHFSRVARGGWADPSAVRRNDYVFSRCPACEPHATGPECTEKPSAPVMSSDAFAPARVALAAQLASEMLDSPKLATKEHALRFTDTVAPQVKRGVARAAAANDFLAWKRALAVRAPGSGASYGVMQLHLDELLPVGFDPRDVLDADDYAHALADIELAKARGRDSGPQTDAFRRALWRRTLERVHGHLPEAGRGIVFVTGLR